MTTVMSPSEFDHLVQVVRHKALGYRGECWCGWAGVWGDDYDVADAVAADHRKVAAGPARGSTQRWACCWTCRMTWPMR